MTANQCVICTRPMPDVAYACVTCCGKAAENLRTLIDTTPAARDVAHGFSRRGTSGASGKPGSRLPLDLAAMSKLDGVQAAMTTWVRLISDTRGVPLP